MFFQKNDPKNEAAEEVNDKLPVTAEDLSTITGGGNPWEKVKGVPQEQIDKDLRDKV